MNRGLAKIHEASREEMTAFVEERAFFRSLGYDDPWIANRLGIDWDSYRRRFTRHPELGPIHDPREQERDYLAGLSNAMRTRGRNNR